MKVFPSERERHASDRRTVAWFFRAMFVLLVGYGAMVAVRHLLS